MKKNNKTKKQVKKTVPKQVQKTEPIQEENKYKKFFKNLFKSKIIDVLLVAIAIGILLFIHHYAIIIQPEDNNMIYLVNEEGLPHLFDMDSYYYARKTREFITEENTDIVTKRSLDKYQTNISDRDDSRYTLLLSKIVSIVYKVINVFKDANLYRIIIYSGTFLSTLVTIPAYIFIRKRTTRIGGFFCAVLAGTSVAYFSHWAYGCFDTDVLLYTIPLIYVCTFIESLVEKNNKKRIVWIVISSLAFILLMFTWDVFGVYYFLTVGLFFVLLLISLIKNKFDFKRVIKLPEVMYSFICVLSYTILSFIINHGIDVSILKDILSVVKPSGVNNMNYPNPGQYTSELSKIDFIDTSSFMAPFEANGASLVNKLGGLFIVSLFICGLILLLTKVYKYLKYEKEEDKEEYVIGIILLIWVIGGLLSVNVGLRFVKIATIPVTLLASYFIGYINKHAYKAIKISLVVLSVAFLITPCVGAQRIAFGMTHSADDAFVETGDYIRTHTKENAVIASWWDYGYFFEYQSNRRALTDGGTYNGRFLYYLANALTNKSELVSTNIFKMLSESGVTVSYVAEEYFKTPKEANKVLFEILNTKTADEAKKILKEKYNLNDEQATRITNYTHPTIDYEIVLVITSNMLKMKSAINYYANYDFDTGEATQEYLEEDALYLALYELDEDTEYYTHMLRNLDPIGKLSTNVFVIK